MLSMKSADKGMFLMNVLRKPTALNQKNQATFILILLNDIDHQELINRVRRQSGFPTFISCQRQDTQRAA